MSAVAAGSVDPQMSLQQHCCAFCSRKVILPAIAQPGQFIICTICERKMLSANAMAEPVAKPETASISSSGTINPAQLGVQPPGQPKPTIIIKPRPPPATNRPQAPLVIKLPATPNSAAGAKKTSSTVPEKEKRIPKVKVPPKRRTSQQSRTPSSKPSVPSEFPLLLARWAATEKAFTTLSNTPHFNEKGEYLFPSTSFPASSAPSKTVSTSSPVSRQPSFIGSMAYPAPLQQFPFVDSLGQSTLNSPSPFVEQPTRSPSVTSSTSSEHPIASNSAQPSSASTRPRLTLRLPSRPVPNKKSAISQPLSSAPLPSVSRVSEGVPSPTTRPCRQLGCAAVLPPSHPWIFCDSCLQSPAPKTISPGDDPRSMPLISTGRRISETSVSLVEVGVPSNDQPRRKSEPVMAPPDALKKNVIRIPQLLKSSTSAVKLESPEDTTKLAKSNAKCALPTPPPSSRQSSPTAPPESSSVPSSPEMPLASLSSPQAPRYKPRDEEADNIWDSDLSELTPLESSDDENSDEEQKGADAARRRVSNTAGGRQSFICVRTKCHNLLVPWSKWKMCHACRVKFRERSRERNNTMFARADSGVGADTSGSQRKCALRTCKNMLPSVSQYRWKMCEGCRTRTRRQSRKRRYGDVDLASDEDGEDLASPMRRRRSSTVNFKKLKLTFKGETVASVEARKAVKEPLSMIVPDNVLRYPTYQTPQLLLESLRNRLLGFITGTTQYLLFKMIKQTALENVQPTVFAFEGEFSLIADPAGGEVGTKIQTVQAEVGKILGIPFALSGYQVEPSGTIIGQYGCVHDILIPFPAKQNPSPLPPPESATDSVSTAPPPSVAPEHPLDALLNLPDDEAPDIQKSSVEKSSEKPSPVPAAGGLPASADSKSAANVETKSVSEPVIKLDPDAVAPLQDKKPLTILITDATPSKASAENAAANFDVFVKRMAGELKISILWDRSHRYFPGLRTIVQFKLVG